MVYAEKLIDDAITKSPEKNSRGKVALSEKDIYELFKNAPSAETHLKATLAKDHAKTIDEAYIEYAEFSAKELLKTLSELPMTEAEGDRILKKFAGEAVF